MFSLSKFHLFALLFVHQPFVVFAFSFLNVCLFFFKQTFQTSHFETQIVFIFGCLLIYSVVLFLFSCFMFLPLSFDVGFVFGMFYFVFVLFLFCSCYVFTDNEKHCFPCNLSVF